MKAKLMIGLVLLAIGIVPWVYSLIVITSAGNEYNLDSYTGYRFPVWYWMICSVFVFSGIITIFWRRKKNTRFVKF